MLQTSQPDTKHAATLARFSWPERVQLAELASRLRDYNTLRQGTYLFRVAFCSLDSVGRPVVVIELGSDQTGLTSRRVVTFSRAEDAREFVSQEMFFYALKAANGVARAQAWRKGIPECPRVSDETFELARPKGETLSGEGAAVLQ